MVTIQIFRIIIVKILKICKMPVNIFKVKVIVVKMTMILFKT